MSTPQGEFAERIPLILVLDTSESMNRPQPEPRIAELNDALGGWLSDAAADPSLRERVEVAIVTFDSRVQVLPDAFALAGAVVPPTLRASGLTLMLPAIETALALARERARALTELGVPARRPMIWLVTDGAPSDERGEPLPAGDVAAVALRLRDAERATADSPGCLFYAIGVGGADLATLRRLAPDSAMKLTDFSYRDILRLATRSATAVRSRATAGQAYEQTRDLADLARGIRGLEDEMR